MKDKKNLFDVQPPAAHTTDIENAVADVLKEKQQQHRRRFLQWMMAPAFASLVGIYLWKKQKTNNEEMFADQDLMVSIEHESDLDLVSDLELIEDLELVEEWNEFEDS